MLRKLAPPPYMDWRAICIAGNGGVVIFLLKEFALARRCVTHLCAQDAAGVYTTALQRLYKYIYIHNKQDLFLICVYRQLSLRYFFSLDFLNN